MSLLRLLAAGKSLVGLKKSESRYQLPANGCLPRFGSKKNPFRATVFPEKSESESGAACRGSESPVHCVEPGKAVEKEMPPAENAEEQKSNQSAAACTVRHDRSGEAPRPRPTGLKALLLWRRVRKSKLSGPFNARSMVQAELSLDMVKVVRNDLSESDLEVVQTAPTVSQKPDKGHSLGSGSRVSAPAEQYYAAAVGLVAAGKS